MASKEQYKLVAMSCDKYIYEGEGFTSSHAEPQQLSCENCANWNGEECTIHVFDKVLTGLDQT